MSTFGYDNPIFNWSSNPLGTIYDSSSTDSIPAENIIDLDVTNYACCQLSLSDFLTNCYYRSDDLVSPDDLMNTSPDISPGDDQIEVERNLNEEFVDFRPHEYMSNYPPAETQEPKVHPLGNGRDEMNMNNNKEPWTPMDTDDDEIHEELLDDKNEKEISKIKLQASKSPIMDALVYCALKRWGIELIEESGDNIRFRVLDFQLYYKYSALICAKQNPTEDKASRIKALKRWFPDFPTKRAGKIDDPFVITVQLANKQDNKPKKLRDIIEKQRRLLGVQKVRRQR
jgi:hypothetical protein